MIYVTSDWHGAPLWQIEHLLEKVNFSDNDFLFVLGDVIDRGAHGVDLLKWLMLRPNAQLIMGNHEAMMLSCDFLFREITEDSIDRLSAEDLELLRVWKSNGAAETIAALSHEPPDMRMDILDFVRTAPLYDSVCVGDRNFLLVHSGLGNYRPDKKISDYTADELLWTRPAYDAQYSADFLTILGHTPTGYYQPDCKGRIYKTDTWWDIDTGGAGPMLLCLDTLQEYYVEFN